MPAKKRPQTKQENNKLYLERKKAKAVASSFEEALEAPASTQIVEAPKIEDKIELPPPTNTDFDSDDWEPYAPKADNVPLAVGETQETAIKPGDWHGPTISIPESTEPPYTPEELELKEGDPLEASPEPLEDVAPPSGHNLPQDTVERLQQAAEAIKWLSQKARAIPPRTKEILRLRTERLEALIPYVK